MAMGISTPFIRAPIATTLIMLDSPILLLGATSETLPLTVVDDNVETKLAQKISQISGVAQVAIGGQQKPSIRVQLDPAKLVAKGLSLEDVRVPLSVTTVNNPKGSINGTTRAYTIYTNGQISSAGDWNDVIVAYRNGNPLRVRDIGTAVSAPQDNTQTAWADGKPGIFLVIFKQPGANVIDTVNSIMATLPQLTASIPPAIKISRQLGDIVLKDPAVDHVAMAIGGNGNPSNTGRMFITLKPAEQRTASADQVITRLQPQLAKVEGARLFLQAAQDIRVGGRPSRTQYQFTLQGSDIDELNLWAPRVLDKMKTLSVIKDVATDQQTQGTTLTLTVNRDQAARYGLTADVIDATLYDAFGQRQIAQYFTQLASYQVIMEILPSLQGEVDTLDKIFLHSPLTGAHVPL
eukprot:gene12761-12858_t